MLLRSNDRSGLIILAREQAFSRACERAFTTGQVVVLGGFDPLSPSTAPGWVVSATSIHGRTWLLGLLADEVAHNVRLVPLDTVPWEHYVGGIPIVGTIAPYIDYNIYNGDDVLSALDSRDARLKELTEDGTTSG